jgi:hypothetical protein
MESLVITSDKMIRTIILLMYLVRNVLEIKYLPKKVQIKVIKQ